MYISRVTLVDNISQNSQLGLLLRDQKYGTHRLLCDLFKQNFLFREESTKDQLETQYNRPMYYVVSETIPDNETPIFQVESKQYDPQIALGDRFSFRLRANPIVAKKTPGKKNSRKHDVLMNAQQQYLTSLAQAENIDPQGMEKKALKQAILQRESYQGGDCAKKLDLELKTEMDKAAKHWLESRSEKNGFTLASVQATGYQWHPLPEKHKKAGFSSMDYEGVICVESPELLLNMLTRGLGPAKRFGCGLMLIRRI